MARSSRGHDELEIFIFAAAKCAAAAAVWQELCRGERSRRRYVHRQVDDDLFPSVLLWVGRVRDTRPNAPRCKVYGFDRIFL